MFNDCLRFGDIFLEFFASEIGVNRICIRESKENIKPNKITDLLKSELIGYLSGEIKQFKTPLDIDGTDFQKLVWSKLREIPYGATNSYKDIAEKIGGSNYSRAVGMANNKNPLPIIIPCHRVIGTNGSLVGYALGLGLKNKLLELEKNKGSVSELPLR